MEIGQSDSPYGEWWPKMKDEAFNLVGVPYAIGSEPDAGVFPPKSLDCSELIQYLFFRQGFTDCPDGSWNQHRESVPVDDPRPGDWGFWGSTLKKTVDNPFGIYHAGMIYNDKSVVEARALDAQGRFGQVILRDRSRWESWEPFIMVGGWRRWKRLVETS